MKILLTGASGYIGSYLTKYLGKEESFEIIPLCRELPEYFEEWKNEFEVMECDILNFNELKDAIPDDIDCIVHLAAFNDIETANNPEQALLVNGIGTRNMLEIAKIKQCKSFIYFSTLQVYGRELSGTVTVNTPTKCENDYSLTHLVAEEYCKMFSLHGLNVSIVRPSNIFGCPVHPMINRWTLVPSTFCLSACEKNEIRLKSSGMQNRDFVSLEYIGKCVKHLINIDEYESSCKTYNISSESLFSIIDLAKIVQSCSKLILNADIDLICESKYPIDSNKFIVKNNLVNPPNKDDLQNELVNEIRKIINCLIQKGDFNDGSD